MTTLDLFERAPIEVLGPRALVLRAFALPHEDALLSALDDIVRAAPWRHMEIPGGRTMSAAMTNAGALGWTSDRRGYRYATHDPLSGRAWPALPPALLALAHDAAGAAGFDGFVPDACLVNRYRPGARLTLHQDRDERCHDHPIVSVSLGMSATFQFGGLRRADPTLKIRLDHGDVVVWGAADRLRFHGVLPLRDEPHPRLGSQRINFTLRKAG